MYLRMPTYQGTMIITGDSPSLAVKLRCGRARYRSEQPTATLALLAHLAHDYPRYPPYLKYMPLSVRPAEVQTQKITNEVANMMSP